MENKDKLSADVIWKMFAETNRRQQETDRLRKESDKRIEAMRKDTDKEIKAISQLVKSNSQEISGVGKGNGRVAEDFFYHSFDKKMKVDNINYDYLHRSLNRKSGELKGEYDIVLINSKSLLLIEVKYRLKSKDVEKFYTKQIPAFKQLFPEYSNYTMYAAVAGLSVDSHAEEEAKKNGILTFTQSGQELKKLSPVDMKPTVF